MAESHLEKALQLIREPEPFSVNGYLAEELVKFDYRDALAWTLHRGQYEEALKELELAIRTQPVSVEANEYMGYLLVTLRKYQEALPYYNKASKYGEQTPVQLNIGALLEHLGERDKTFEYYRGVAHNPELSILAGFLLAFPETELSPGGKDLHNRLRDWLNQTLDREIPEKEEPTAQSPLELIKSKFTGLAKCPLCGNKEAGLFYEDRTNQRKIRRCLNCKIIYVWPQPTFTEVKTWYGKRYFEHSLEQGRKILDLWKKSIDNGTHNFHPTGKQFSLIFQWLESLGLKEFEESLKTKRMLDIGCATGGLLAEFISRGWEATGVELSESAVKFDRRMGFDVIQGTVEDGKFPDGHFDLVTMTHVIEHLPNPTATLKEISRILKPGGFLFIRTPNAESLPRLITGKKWFEDHDHLFFFGNRSLNSLLNKCNFMELGVKCYVGIDIETYREVWDRYRLNDLIRARINRADLGDVILLFARNGATK